jgi:NAD dependent epimerase/dehydratase family enzyme
MMSWIHYTDLVRAFEYAISHPLKGTYNLCSPNAVSSRNFAKALAKVLKRPHFLSIPALALRLVYGKAASVLTSSQHAIPEKLLQEGYSFEFPEIHEALESLFKIPTK